jgi:2-polyprenyl-6-methoxyphenol hydroxylase-like FAD-dependent oxidoreductase
MNATELETGCCIVGGGPAGLMLGFLLARAGVNVTVLEKHKDFLRDFRGDTIHPSTLEVMHELGLLDDFLRLPHETVRELTASIGDERVTIADFSHLPTRCKFIALMPQWDFLNFIAQRGRYYPGFDLRMEWEAADLIFADDRIVGVRGTSPQGDFAVRADLIVGADGRHSVLRTRTGLTVEDLGAPMDVLWMRLSRRPDDDQATIGRVGAGGLFITLNRGDYWQCAMIIAKGTADAVRRQGVEAFRERIVSLAPSLRERVCEIEDWDDVKLLTVTVDCLRQWYRPGLLCIGDAAHAMSPIGGVGINLAIQDAVAAANILAVPLRQRAVAVEHLHAVQERRTFPTRATQRMQVFIQNRFLRRVLASTTPPRLPWLLRTLLRCPLVRRIPGRLIGVGFRPEHVRTGAQV